MQRKQSALGSLGGNEDLLEGSSTAVPACEAWALNWHKIEKRVNEQNGAPSGARGGDCQLGCLAGEPGALKG